MGKKNKKDKNIFFLMNKIQDLQVVKMLIQCCFIIFICMNPFLMYLFILFSLKT